MKRKLTIVVYAIFALALVLGAALTPVLGAAPALALPPLPHAFYGTVTPGPIGTVITAQVGGVEYGSYTTSVVGEYGNPAENDYLIVQGAIAPGATIDFYLDGVKADQTYPFEPGGGPTPLNLTIFAFEVGQVSINHLWTTVNLTKTFTDLVVVAKPLSYNGGDPATVRIRNVTPTSFQARIQEWQYLDGWHTMEQVGYMVMERGHHTLLTGAHVEAGTINTNSTGVASFVPVNFSSTFPTTPVVASSVMSFNGTDTVVTRNRNVTTTGFEVTMQEQQSNAPWHVAETISYIAWEPGTGTVDDPIAYEVGTQSAVNHNWSTISYGPFGDVPIVLMDMQTASGPDPCNLRYRNKDADSVEVKVDEERSKDSEKWHTNETVGYFAFY